MKLFRRSLFSLSLIFVAVLSSAQAAVIVRYGIDVGKTRTAEPQAPSVVAAHVKAGPLSPYADGKPNTNAASARGPAFNFDFGFLGPFMYKPGIGDSYFAFTLDIEKGYAVDFNSISFFYRAPSLNGKKVFWEVRSSADNYQSTLAILSSNLDGGTKGSPGESGYNSGDMPIDVLKGQTGSITFRIYLYEEAEGTVTGSYARIGNIAVLGTVVPQK